MIAVTTPTGTIGSQVAASLLAAGEAVRVIARDPAKLAQNIREKAEVVQGSLDDEEVVSRTLDGAESLFFVVPPSFTTKDYREHYLQFTRPVCRAIRAHGVKRVVSVSGIGRKANVDAGLVMAAFAKDDEIEKTGVEFRALWCPGFMENMLGQVEALKHQGAFFSILHGDRKVPLVATRDIAASGVRLLRNRSWTGQDGLAVLGPEDISADEMASIMTDVLGKPIRYQQVPVEAYKAQLVKFGASESMAEGLIKMFTAKDNGLDSTEPRTAENTTPTSFRQWCQEVLKPAFLS